MHRHATRWLVIGVLIFATAWGIVTLFNAIRLGSRGYDASLYWVSTAVIALLTTGLGLLAARLVRRARRP